MKTDFEKEAFEFLIDLRDSGRMNMWGAPKVLAEVYNISLDEAKTLFFKWIESFEKSE